MKASRGFTLVELIIYVGLTAMVMGLFGSIIITILRVQGEQSSSTQVSTELSFIITTIKKHIHEAATVQSNGTQLSIIKNDSNHVTVLFDIGSHSIVIADDSIGPSERINSNRVNIDSALFEKLQDATNPLSAAIRMTITASASSTDPGRQSTKTVRATASPFLQSQ